MQWVGKCFCLLFDPLAAKYMHFFFFLLQLWHVEVSGLGIEPVLQLQHYHILNLLHHRGTSKKGFFCVVVVAVAFRGSISLQIP